MQQSSIEIRRSAHATCLPISNSSESARLHAAAQESPLAVVCCCHADLVTDANSRSKGYGRQLLEWLRLAAAAEGCDAVWLTSGAARVDAHRFYEANGMGRVGHVFLCSAKGVP